MTGERHDRDRAAARTRRAGQHAPRRAARRALSFLIASASSFLVGCGGVLGVPDGPGTVQGLGAVPQAAEIAQTAAGDEAPPPIVPAALRERDFRGDVNDRLELRPDLFAGRGPIVWRGDETLPGIWISHPAATTYARVRLYSPRTGRAADGALVPSAAERPALSAEAADALSLPFGRSEIVVVAVAWPGEGPRVTVRDVPIITLANSATAAVAAGEDVTVAAIETAQLTPEPGAEAPGTPGADTAGATGTLSGEAPGGPAFALAGIGRIDEDQGTDGPASAREATATDATEPTDDPAIVVASVDRGAVATETGTSGAARRGAAREDDDERARARLLEQMQWTIGNRSEVAETTGQDAVAVPLPNALQQTVVLGDPAAANRPDASPQRLAAFGPAIVAEPPREQGRPAASSSSGPAGNANDGAGSATGTGASNAVRPADTTPVAATATPPDAPIRDAPLRDAPISDAPARAEPSAEVATSSPAIATTATAPAAQPAAAATGSAPEPTTPEQETVTPAGQRYLQAGIFREELYANRLVAGVEAAGLPAAALDFSFRGRPAKRVRIGPLSSDDEIRFAREVLSGYGIRDAVSVAQ